MYLSLLQNFYVFWENLSFVKESPLNINFASMYLRVATKDILYHAPDKDKVVGYPALVRLSQKKKIIK